jgi:hypothetical protein
MPSRAVATFGRWQRIAGWDDLDDEETVRRFPRVYVEKGLGVTKIARRPRKRHSA